MKRNHSVVVGALGLAMAFVPLAADARIELPPVVMPPIYEAALRHNARCLFRLTAKWRRTTEVAAVNAQWYLDGAFLFTTEAPGTGPNAGTIGRSSAVMEAGPSNTSSRGHAWKALVQFYSASGAQLVDLDQCRQRALRNVESKLTSSVARHLNQFSILSAGRA